MANLKPTYDELIHENLALKLKLAQFGLTTKLYEELRLKNAELEEMNEELKQTAYQLKENKEKLERTENLYHLLANNITDVIWIMDLAGNFTYVSPSAVCIFGYSVKDLSSLKVKDVLTEDSYNNHMKSLSERLEREKRGEITSFSTFVLQNIKKNGQIIWVEVIVSPLRDENNRIYSLLGVTRDITGRILVEDKLNKLSVAVEQSPTSIVITGLDGSIEYVNATFSKLTGYSIEEALGKDPKILQSGQTPRSVYDSLWKTIMAGKIWQGEFVNQKKNGELYWENATIAPIKDNQGQITNFVAIKENITSKKSSEQDFLKSQERYKLLSDISLEGIIIYENGKISDINQSLTKVTGFSRKELIGLEQVNKLFTPESIKIISEKLNTEYSLPFEIEGIKKNGDIYPAEMEIRQLKYKGRDLRISALRDISYRKRVDDVLRSSLKLTELLEDNTEQQIIDWGLEEAVRLSDSQIGFFHYVNDDQETITLQTWSKNTLKNCKVPEITLHYPISEAGTWVECFHTRKPVVHNDYESLRHKHGLPEGHFPLYRYISLPVIEGDKVKIIFGVGNKDVNYSQFDVDVLSLFAKTVWIVLQRKRTELKLREANDTKAKFLSIISHDLRSPISSIGSLTEMIIDNEEMLSNSEIIELIKVINQTSKTSYEQLENMLTWSRAQTSNLEFKPEIIDIKPFLIKFASENEYLCLKKNIELKVNIESEISVFADKNMLVSIIMNLLNNAIKFTPENGKVTINLKSTDNNFATISIIDNGVGIDSKRIKHLFSLQKSSSTFGTNNEKGSGLGLLLSKEFIEKNGGIINVESELGNGSVFSFTLPIAKQ